MLVKNISSKPWVWPFTEDGTPDVVQPGEEYWLDLRLKRRQSGESSIEYRERLARPCPKHALLDALYRAGVLRSVPPPPETMH